MNKIVNMSIRHHLLSPITIGGPKKSTQMKNGLLVLKFGMGVGIGVSVGMKYKRK